METEPIYNVYEIVMGAIEWEESFDSWDEAQNAFRNRANHIYSERLNDYGPEDGDGLYFYSVPDGNMIDQWLYAAS